MTIETTEKIESQIKVIIADKLGVNIDDVVPEAVFTADLGADSLDQVELIMEFEKEFNLEIPDIEAENIKTVQDAIDFVKTNIK